MIKSFGLRDEAWEGEISFVMLEIEGIKMK